MHPGLPKVCADVFARHVSCTLHGPEVEPLWVMVISFSTGPSCQGTSTVTRLSVVPRPSTLSLGVIFVFFAGKLPPQLEALGHLEELALPANKLCGD